MQLTALQLASHAQLWVSRVSAYGVAVRDGGRILVGPYASEDLIATIAARRLVQLRAGMEDVPEELVRAEVRSWGFRYTRIMERCMQPMLHTRVVRDSTNRRSRC